MTTITIETIHLSDDETRIVAANCVISTPDGTVRRGREHLDLPATASEDEIKAALAAKYPA
jgi:hypothetical protein